MGRTIGASILAAVATLLLAAGWLAFAEVLARAEPAVSEADVADQTIDVFEERFRNDPYRYPDGERLVDLYVLRFERAASLSDLARAEEIARLLLPVAAVRATAEARLALILIARHAFGEAFEHASAAVADDPDNDSALAALFDASLALGRYPEAERALAGMKPRTVARRLREASWLGAHGALREAGRLMRGACDRLERSPAPAQVTAWCLTRWADFEHQRSGPDAARALLLRAIRADPGHRGAIEGLADLAHAEEAWAEAERLYLRIQADAHPDLYLRLAEVYRRLGRDDLAAPCEARFMRIASDPASEKLYARELAIFLAGAPDVELRTRALETAARDVARRPTAESYEVLAWAHLQLAKPREALAALDGTTVWGETSSAAALYLRARALEDLGAVGEAEALYAAALADPTLLPPHLRRDRSDRLGTLSTRSGPLPTGGSQSEPARTIGPVGAG